VPIYEYESPAREFRYRVWYSQHTEGWKVDAAQVLRFNNPLTPRQPLRGAYAESSEAIAKGVQWCEEIVTQLKPIDRNKM